MYASIKTNKKISVYLKYYFFLSIPWIAPKKCSEDFSVSLFEKNSFMHSIITATKQHKNYEKLYVRVIWKYFREPDVWIFFTHS